MDIEAVVLTGGKSERMGADKSALEVEGVPLGRRIADAISEQDIPVTVLGREPIKGYAFLADEADYQGPLCALSKFLPSAELVFVAGCDMPIFDAMVIGLLDSNRGEADACVPIIQGMLQPTCGLYRSTSFEAARDSIAEGKKSLFAWLDKLDVCRVSEDELRNGGIDPKSCLGANTPEELQGLLNKP